MIDLGQGLILPEARSVTRYDTREEWLAHRGTIGASDAPKVLGLSPFGGPWSVYEERVLGVERRQTDVQARGQKWERRVMEDYVEATGHRVHGPLGWTVVRGEPWWLGVSLDGFAFDQEWGTAEVKTDRSGFRWGKSGQVIESWSDAAAREIREDNAVQCYLGLAATGLPWCRLLVLLSLDDLRWYTLVRDPALERSILPILSEWCDTHVSARIPPDVDDSEACARAMARMFPPGAPMVDASPEDLVLVAERIGKRKLAEEAKREADLADNRLGERIGKAGARGLTLPKGFEAGSTVLWVRPEGKKPHIRIY